MVLTASFIEQLKTQPISSKELQNVTSCEVANNTASDSDKIHQRTAPFFVYKAVKNIEGIRVSN